jgi:hypothetical protein
MKKFILELELTPDELAQVVIDYATRVKSVRPVENGKATVKRKSVTQASHRNAVLEFVGADSYDHLQPAVRVAAKLGAKARSARKPRKEWVKLIAPLMARAGYKATGAQPAVTELVRHGILVEVKDD